MRMRRKPRLRLRAINRDDVAPQRAVAWLIRGVGYEADKAQAVAGDDAVALAKAAVHFEYILRIAIDGVDRFRKRRCVLDDADDLSIGAGEDHVERDERVLHPEGQVLRLLEQEDHAGLLVEMAAVHQSEFALRVGGGNLDVYHDKVAAVLSGDCDFGLLLCAGGEYGHDGYRDGDGRNQYNCGQYLRERFFHGIHFVLQRFEVGRLISESEVWRLPGKLLRVRGSRFPERI